MEITNQQSMPEEIRSFTDRLTILSNGVRYLDELIGYDYTGIVIKIKFLAVDPHYKTAINLFLQSTAIPIIDHAYDIKDQIIAGITKKAKYAKPTGIQALQLYGNNNSTPYLPDEFIGYDRVTNEDILHAKDIFLDELTYYSHHLKPLVKDNFEAIPQGNSGRSKIKTNLSLDELAMLFKILFEYDEVGSGKKKILQVYEIKRDLHRAVSDTFITTGSDEIKLTTYENRYSTGDQIDAVDFWVDKFLTLKLSAARLKQDLIDKEDKAKAKKNTKTKKINN